MHRTDGRVLERHRCFSNSQSGYQQAKAWLLALQQAQAADGFVLGGEATSYYWLPLFVQLAQDPDWVAHGLSSYLLNPRWVKWFKKSRSPTHKTDQSDPSDIAEYLRLQTPHHSWSYDAHWLPLRFSTRLRAHLVRSLTREKNHLDLYLFLAFSTYTQQHPFSTRLAKTSQALLSDPAGLRAWATADLAELTQHLRDLSRQHLPHPQQNAARLQEVLRDSFVLPSALTEPIHAGLQILLGTIQSLQTQIRQVEALITQQLSQADYPQVDWLDSVPGVGRVLATGIATEIGDLTRFTQTPVWDARHQRHRPRSSGEVVDAVSKFAGLWWPKNASGQFEAEERRLSREGNAYLRYYVLEAADWMRLRIPSFHAYYLSKFNQATKHKHKRALVLTGSKALQLFVTLLRRQEPYRAKEVDRCLLTDK